MGDTDAHANLVITIIGLAALGIGTLAWLLRIIIQRRRTHPEVLGTFVSDVKRGEGFTFHKKLVEGAPDTLPTVSWSDFLQLVNERPDEVPHIGIEGGTGTTKTTLAEAIVSTRRAGQIVVITAKPDEHEWGGLPFVTIDDDGGFTEAQATFQAILSEINRRLVLAKKRQNVGSWLTVVLDDFTRLRAKCLSAAEVIEFIGDQGRSIRVHLILITRSKLVEALGIEGQGDRRDNLVFIRLDRQRRSTLEWADTAYQVDIQPAYQQSYQGIASSRAWAQPDNLLLKLFPHQTVYQYAPAPAKFTLIKPVPVRTVLAVYSIRTSYQLMRTYRHLRRVYRRL